MPTHPLSHAEPDLPISVDSGCAYLDWDSQFFGCRIGSVRQSCVSGESLIEIEEWCRAQRIDCIYFLSDFADPGTIRLAETNGFHLVDIRLTLATDIPRGLAPVAGSGKIRISREADIPVLRALARMNHHDSRFYFDPNFPRDRCDALYETWMEKSCRDYADVVLVPEVEGTAAGYISCHLGPEQSGQIGLVGLAPEARGKGLGLELIQTAMHWFHAQGVKRVTVVTQGRNIAAQRLYQKNGFVTQSVQLWYHRWFLPGTSHGN